MTSCSLGVNVGVFGAAVLVVGDDGGGVGGVDTTWLLSRSSCGLDMLVSSMAAGCVTAAVFIPRVMVLFDGIILMSSLESFHLGE